MGDGYEGSEAMERRIEDQRTSNYRKRPVVIQARRLSERTEIKTLEGLMVGNSGDWLITGVKGEQYPCKDDIFRATYEPVSQDELRERRQAFQRLLDQQLHDIGLELLTANLGRNEHNDPMWNAVIRHSVTGVDSVIALFPKEADPYSDETLKQLVARIKWAYTNSCFNLVPSATKVEPKAQPPATPPPNSEADVGAVGWHDGDQG